ncbi:MAG: hypothetical protein ACXAEB_06635 [Candidatus Thorarchaeota archaeon]
MSDRMKEITVTGLVSKILNQYVITTDDGTEFQLSAIMPWESVSADYGTDEFAQNLGRKMTASGVTDGQTIWKASLTETIEK